MRILQDSVSHSVAFSYAKSVKLDFSKYTLLKDMVPTKLKDALFKQSA